MTSLTISSDGKPAPCNELKQMVLLRGRNRFFRGDPHACKDTGIRSVRNGLHSYLKILLSKQMSPNHEQECNDISE
jgi:hypothetical protein